MIERFVNEMTRVEKTLQSKLTWRGLTNSIAQTIPFFLYDLSIFYSCHLIASKEVHFKNMLKLVKKSIFYIDLII